MPRPGRPPALILMCVALLAAAFFRGTATTPSTASPLTLPHPLVVPSSAPAPVPVLAAVAARVDDVVARMRREDRRRARARRRAEARRLARSRTPEAVVRRAWLLHLSDRATYDRYRGILARARRIARVLPGARGREQRDAVAAADRLAARHVLTADRLAPVLLTLSRNTDWWIRRGAPAVGRSIVRGDGPVTLRYVPGQGLVLHQLASWSLVGSLAGSCLRDRQHCPRRRLAAAVDTMMALAVRRDGVVRAESYFAFGAARPPWISAMTQGGAIQALIRSSVVLHRAADRRRALAALGAFARRAPEGVAVPAEGGRHFLMYSTAPSLRILNGDLRALSGLRDLATLGGSRRAAKLFRSGERAARVQLRQADTGAWSRYADGGPEASLGYHRLVTTFLRDLCDRRAGRRYCGAARRFSRYVKEPTRVSVRVPQPPRAQTSSTATVWISKVSAVQFAVIDARGRTVLRRGAQLARGTHRFAWWPPRHGTYTVTATAAGPGSPPLGRGSTKVVARRSASEISRRRAVLRAKARAEAKAHTG